jgi:tRNA nucleotidyltransferase/poly(A) polymerase
MPVSAEKDLAVWTARFSSLLHRPTCQLLREVLGHRPCHLVGGVLRDLALGQSAHDLDIVVAGDGAAVADRLAERLGSRSIRLGGDRFAAYRVTRQGSPIDIWDRGAAPLEADLRRRDFTIHSFALDLHSGALQDPFSGLDDLARSRLRMTTPEAFADDPLRILRLCRFAAQLEGFRIESATRTQAREAVPDLEGIASERIRTEIELTLSQTHIAPAAELWLELRIVPEELLQASLEPELHRHLQAELSRTLRRLEKTAESLPVTARLASARLALVLIQLGRIGSASAAASLESLVRQGFVAKATARQVARLLALGTLPTVEPKLRWFLHQAGELWPDALSLAAALEESSTGATGRSAQMTRAIHLATQRAAEIFDPPALITGKDLLLQLNLEAGEQLGRILAAIRQQQIEGTITTRAGALELAGQLLTADGHK